MKDKIPKKALEDYYEMNAIELSEIEHIKNNFNSNVMKDKEQSNAMLQLHLQELEINLEQITKERNSFEVAYAEEKKRNECLVKKMVDYNKMVDEHLKKVITELEAFNENNASFIERLVIRIKMKRFLNGTKKLKPFTQEQANET